MTDRIGVLLVDDHTVVRQGLRRILETDDEIEVVGEARDGRSAVEMAERLKPAVVVMDVALPELNGVEATRQIMKHNGDARVLILTTLNDDVYVRQSLRAGARGYLFKDSEDVDLLRAVKAIGRGDSFFSPAVSQILLDGYRDGRDPRDHLEQLTDREREVLQLIAEGKTNKEIANLLSVSLHTVESHRKHVMKKLDLHNTAEIAHFALRMRVIH
jgi:two-component system, NarL family, response regulator NreC